MKSRLGFILLSLFFLAACGSSSDSSDSSASSLTVRLTDAPVDEAANVFVTLRGIALNHDESGWVDHDFESPRKIDLLTLDEENTITLFDEDDVESGSYQVRLNLYENDDNALEQYIVIEEGGEEFELRIPSGSQTGLKLSSAIVVPEGGEADYTIDFDVRRSVVLRGNASNNNGYQLKPVLRLIDNSGAGSLSDTIDDSALLTTECSDDDPLTFNRVYVFEGADVTPDDIDGDDVEPLTTASVDFNEENGVYSYTVGFLAAGDYTVSLTCNADLEDLEEDDDLKFKATENKTVVASASDDDEDDEEET